MQSPRVAIVILNYNSDKDLRACAESVAGQICVNSSVVLVDNASCAESLCAVKDWLGTWRPDAICGSEANVVNWISVHPECCKVSGAVYLVENRENRGYSAGNNTGIRIAEALQADAVLIANPDMRIEDPNYIQVLASHLFSNSDYQVAVSRIVGLDGDEQNPLREPRFWEEFLWPRFLLRRFFKPNAYVLPCPPDRPSVVPKVAGCCLMLRMDFLQKSGGFDENVFLYCEEPILAARVRDAGGKMIYVPTISAVHAHIASEKGDSTKRMLQFIASRKYYLKKYSGYNSLQLGFLNVSYALLAGYNRMKGLCSTVLNPGSRHA